MGTDSSGHAAQGDVQEQTSRPVCRGHRLLLVFGAQQPVGPAVPSNWCDDLSWIQSRRRVSPLCHPGPILSEASPCVVGVLDGRLGRGGLADPTNPTVFGRTHNWSPGDYREGSAGWDVTRAVSAHPYHLRPARRLWLQVWLTSEFLPLVEYLELALDAIALACAAKLGVGNEMEGFVRSPAWALLHVRSGLWCHRRNEGLLGLCRASAEELAVTFGGLLAELAPDWST